jgi:hypothetical protein
MNAVMDALAAHTTMSKQAIDSEKVRAATAAGGFARIILQERIRSAAKMMIIGGARLNDE